MITAGKSAVEFNGSTVFIGVAEVCLHRLRAVNCVVSYFIGILGKILSSKCRESYNNLFAALGAITFRSTGNTFAGNKGYVPLSILNRVTG